MPNEDQEEIANTTDYANNQQTLTPDLMLVSEPQEQTLQQKPSKWRFFFFLLGILQVVGVLYFLLTMKSLVNQAEQGVSGTEFFALFLFITVVPSIGLVALTNLIGLPLYMRRHKTQGRALVLSVASLVLSSILVLYGVYIMLSIVVS